MCKEYGGADAEYEGCCLMGIYDQEENLLNGKHHINELAQCKENAGFHIRQAWLGIPNLFCPAL